MLNIQFISDKKPGARNNEDLFGFKGDTFWLLDGATSTDGPPLDRDAYWLVHELDTALNGLATRGLDVDEMAATACSMVADRWPSTSPRRPVAAMAVWRLHEGYLDAAITGNVSLLVPAGTSVVELTDSRVVPAHAGASTALLQALAGGLTFESPEFQDLRRKMKEQEAGALDVHAAGWLAAPAQRRPEDFCRFTVANACAKPMLASTDGFMELGRFLRSKGSADFLNTVQELSGNLTAAVQQLRAFELAPDSGQRFPRTKRHDDATAVLIHLT